MRRWRLAMLWSLLALCGPTAGMADPARTGQGDIPALLARLQAAVQQGDAAALLALVAPGAAPTEASAFAAAVFASAPATRVTIRERDRVPLRDVPPQRGLRLAVDALVEQGDQARIHSWQLDVTREESAGAPWLIRRVESSSFLEGLERLGLDAHVQYRSRGLVVQMEDAQLRLPDGVVYLVRSGGAVTGAVLVGNADLVFRPSSAVERGQVRIFCGSETLSARVDDVFLRFSAADAERLLPASALEAEPVDPKALSRAAAILRSEGPKSYVVDLGDLGSGTWWVRPQPRDVVAEIHTKKFGTLTYAHAWQDHENVSLFDRGRKRHVAVYASESKLAERGRFYDDSDGGDVEVLRYDVDAALAPAAHGISAWTRLRLRVVEDGLARLTLRLADALTVETISSAEHGRLLGFRARGRNSLVVNFPRPLAKGTEITLSVSYSGTLPPLTPGQESLQFPQVSGLDEGPIDPMPMEASYLYSQRSNWYVQATDPGYATASIRLKVPADYTCVASGELTTGGPLTMGVVSSKNPGDAQRLYQFEAKQPVRYLAFVVSRFSRMDGGRIALPPRNPGLASTTSASETGVVGPEGRGSLLLAAEVTRRFRSQGQKLLSKAADMAKLYTELAGGCPYPALTLALIEHELPGGHSPAYFSVVNQVMPSTSRTRRTWAADPAAFPDFPDYVLAHEVAHQWWGQAVGTKNYHEQWISEGFAQYFAAVYAERVYGPLAYRTIVRRFRRWTLDTSDRGPIHLGARLGHIQGDSRIFRALVYNKGALVLHMLRQLLGDEVFFRGLRRFYAEYRFKQAGTGDVQRVFEAESGRSLEQFFEGWVFGQDVPRLSVAAQDGAGTDGRALTLRIEQEGPLFEVPVPVLVDFADGTSRTFIVPISGRSTTRDIPVDRPVRAATVSVSDLAARVRPG